MSCKNCSIQRGLKKVRSFLGSRSQWERGNGPRWPCSFGSSESLRVKVLDKFCQWSKQSNFQSCQKEQRGMHRGCSQCCSPLVLEFQTLCKGGKRFTAGPQWCPFYLLHTVHAPTQPGRSPRKRKKVSLTTSSPCPGPPASHPQEQNGLDPSLSSGSPDSW